MKSFYVEFQRTGWLRAIMMSVLGLWIVLRPHVVFGLLVNILAVVLLVMGISNLISGLRVRRAGGASYGLGSGVALIVAALLVEVLAGAVIAMFPLLFGIGLMIYGITALTGAQRSRQYVNVSNTSGIVYGILVVIAGLILLVNPFGSAMMLFRIFGGILLAMGLMEAVNWFKYRQ